MYSSIHKIEVFILCSISPYMCTTLLLLYRRSIISKDLTPLDIYIHTPPRHVIAMPPTLLPFSTSFTCRSSLPSC
jgi:hypothetical protein